MVVDRWDMAEAEGPPIHPKEDGGWYCRHFFESFGFGQAVENDGDCPFCGSPVEGFKEALKHVAGLKYGVYLRTAKQSDRYAQENGRENYAFFREIAFEFRKKARLKKRFEVMFDDV